MNNRRQRSQIVGNREPKMFNPLDEAVVGVELEGPCVRVAVFTETVLDLEF